ncbi:MAG: hypothetical protein NC433_07460 [Clostridiales bacterium]|nr:hypothetical protein [Clostridiales bacterium]
MISDRFEIINLLNEYLETEHEQVTIFWGGAPEWSEKRKVQYINGIVVGKFREKDKNTINVLNEEVADTALYKEICIYLQNEINEYKQMDQLDIIQQANYISATKGYELLKNAGIEEWINKYAMFLKDNVEELNANQFKTFLFLYYSFQNYRAELNSPYNTDQSILEEIYGGIFEKQSQFVKYGLLPIDDSRELLTVDPPRVYDHILDKTLFTKNVPLHLLERLYMLKKTGYIRELAIRLKNEKCYEGKLVCEYLAEALERGKYFSLSELGSYSVTRLYSEQYEDCLWVVTDSGDITFEELCEDFETYEDMVVTQVIHLEYENEGREVYITHLDHEYIFYSIEEYELRTVNWQQKGNAKTRMKSFKIDNSRIPFEYEFEIRRKDVNGLELPIERVQILSYILETYFKHKDLLKEYFQAQYNCH